MRKEQKTELKLVSHHSLTINLTGTPGALSSVSKVADIFMINENYSGSNSRSAQIGLHSELVVGFDMKRKRGCNL